MPEFSPPFQRLVDEVCATCGGSMPCALHNAALREAMLRPRERAGLPWEKIERREIGTYSRPIAALGLLPDGAFLVAGYHAEIARFDPSKPEGAHEEILGYYHERGRREFPAYAVAALPSGAFVLGGVGGELVEFDPAKSDGERTKCITNVRHDVYTIVPREDGALIVGGIARGGVTVVDPVRGTTLMHIEDSASVYGLHVLPGDTPLIGRSNGDLVIRDWKDPQGLVDVPQGSYGNAIAAFLSLPDGTIIIGGRGGRIVRFDPAAPKGARMQELGNFGMDISAIVATSDHAFAVAGNIPLKGGVIAEYAIPEDALRAYHERRLDAPKIPPMPDA